jgi:hypothetical protein
MATVVKKFNTATTGALPAVATARPANKFTLQVKGVAVAATSWTVLLEGSLDGVNFTTLATHNATDGSTIFAVDKVCSWVRPNCTALTLGSATSINVFVGAMN